MSYTIELKPSAIKELSKIPKKAQKRLIERVDSLAENPRAPGTEKLDENLYRTRVGDYRIIYEIRDKVLTVLVVRIRHRREVYRNL